MNIGGLLRYFIKLGINRLLGQPQVAEISGQPKACVYVRVSTKKQEEVGNLERQRTRVVNYCIEKGYALIGVYSDIASGLNPKRRGLAKLLTAVKKGKVDLIVVEYQDRLARFGYEYIQRYCLDNGAAIEIIHQQEDPNSGEFGYDLNQELVEDLIAIVSSFSARLYGSRGGRVAKKVATVLEEAKCIE